MPQRTPGTLRSLTGAHMPPPVCSPVAQKEKQRLERELRQADAKLSGDGALEDRVLKAVSWSSRPAGSVGA